MYHDATPLLPLWKCYRFYSNQWLNNNIKLQYTRHSIAVILKLNSVRHKRNGGFTRSLRYDLSLRQGLVKVCMTNVLLLYSNNPEVIVVGPIHFRETLSCHLFIPWHLICFHLTHFKRTKLSVDRKCYLDSWLHK